MLVDHVESQGSVEAVAGPGILQATERVRSKGYQALTAADRLVLLRFLCNLCMSTVRIPSLCEPQVQLRCLQ